MFRTKLLGTIVRMFGSDVRFTADDDIGMLGAKLFDANVGLLGPDVW